MSRSSTRIWCAIVIVAVLGLPASGQAQSPRADSVLTLTDAELHRALRKSASPSENQSSWGQHPGTTLKGVAKGAATGAAIGFIAGLVAGSMINRYCHNEGASCSHVVLKIAATGMGIGAAVGSAAAVSR